MQLFEITSLTTTKSSVALRQRLAKSCLMKRASAFLLGCEIELSLVALALGEEAGGNFFSLELSNSVLACFNIGDKLRRVVVPNLRGGIIANRTLF